MLKKNIVYCMDQICVDAFNILKEKLIIASTLAIHDPEKETELHTDACKLVFGAVLLQRQVVSYFLLFKGN